MKKKHVKELLEFAIDHYVHFDTLPMEFEASNGDVYNETLSTIYKDYSLHLLMVKGNSIPSPEATVPHKCCGGKLGHTSDCKIS